MVVERKDGSLWMVARTAKGLMESTSTDRGQMWAEPSASGIKHPAARFHIRRLASGRLLLVKHGKSIEAHEGRSQLTAWTKSRALPTVPLVAWFSAVQILLAESAAAKSQSAHAALEEGAVSFRATDFQNEHEVA